MKSLAAKTGYDPHLHAFILLFLLLRMLYPSNLFRSTHPSIVHPSIHPMRINPLLGVLHCAKHGTLYQEESGTSPIVRVSHLTETERVVLNSAGETHKARLACFSRCSTQPWFLVPTGPS